MDTERRIEQAIKAGEKNRRIVQLIRNWCSHARILKTGGTGIVEMQTGLPIGHHAMACDYAAANGMATWDLADAALDFHDRNCVDCPHRKPGGLPNLTSLLREREARVAKSNAERAARERKAAAELEARRAARQAMRSQLDTVAATVLDQLDSLDLERSEEARQQLLATGKLAPEFFASPIIEHCFALIEAQESWFDKTGLQLLRDLNADPARLTRCALISLRSCSAVEIAASIIECNIHHVDEALIAGALPALVALASPTHVPFGDRRRPVTPTPLIQLHRRYRAAVEGVLTELLGQKSRGAISTAARAISVLSESDKAVAGRFARSLAAKLARAKWLIEGDVEAYDYGNSLLGEVRRALVLAFQHDPDQVDSLLEKFLKGAPSDGQARIYSAYRQVLHDDGGTGDRKRSRPTSAYRVALKRLIWAATSSEDDEVIQEIQDVFSGRPYGLSLVVREEIDSLLGAAVLLDDRLRRFDASNPPPANLLYALEHSNRRGNLVSLQRSFVRWAASAASGDNPATKKIMEILSSIPEERDELRGAMISYIPELVVSSETLNTTLPALYSAMMGASTLLRASAARALEDLDYRRRRDVPELLLEAFLPLLTDPYVIVHKAAVGALRRFTLPERLASQVMVALTNLIVVYANSHSDDEFLMKCIALYIDRYAGQSKVNSDAAKFFIEILNKMRPYVVARELASLNDALCDFDGFIQLILRILLDEHVRGHRNEYALKIFKALPSEKIRSSKDEIVEAAASMGDDRSLAGVFLEVLTRVGAWSEAAQMAETRYNLIPDTISARPNRLAANLHRIAAGYEEAVSAGRLDILPDLADQWRTTRSQIHDDRIRNEERRDPRRGFLSSN